jgi:uncharacterized protein (DUF1015 family)
MSDVKPFKGLRPKADLVAKVAAPPYDVMNSEEAREMAKGNPLSFLHVSKAEIDFPPQFDSHSPEVYEKGAANLRKLEGDGIMFRDPVPCFYLYRLKMGEHVQTGFVIGASVAEYEAGLIKKHELTRRDKEDDRAHHVDVLDNQSGPVLLTYRATSPLDALLDRLTRGRPDYDFVAPDGIGHTLWVVANPADVEAIRVGFGEVAALYIADGHHRSAAAFRCRNLRRDRNPNHDGSELYNHFLAVAFPDDQLKIQGYYRVVKDLNGRTSEQFLAEIGGKFTVAPTGNAMPEGLHQFTMFLDGKWFRLEPKSGTFRFDDPVRSLDCSILQDNLLAPVLGIADPRTDKRVDFVGGIRGTKELERRCGLDMKVAFALYPVTVGQLMAIADSDAIMPPKSTWFEPKLRDAMVTRSLDDKRA